MRTHVAVILGPVVFIAMALISPLWAADDSLHRGNGAEPDSLNPHLAQGLNSHNILNDLYEGLFTYDVSGRAIPGVAERYQVSGDGLIWNFYLNPDAKWSDGEPVTSKDFIEGWNKAIAHDSAAPYAFLFDNMQSKGQLTVTSENKHHLRIELNHIDASLPDKLLLPVFAPIPVHSPDRSVYNGAYAVTEHRPHEWIKLQKNPHYHQAEAVYFENIYYVVTENQNSELLKFRAGELDITETIPDSQLDWLREHYPKALRIAPYNGSFFLGLNLADQHLKDLNLRQALHWSVDRDILVNKVLKSGQKPANGLIPMPDQATNAFNLNKAKQYLAQSDFNPDSDRLELLYNNSNNQKKTALAVAAMWRQFLGIKTRLKNQEWKVFIKTRQGPNKQVFRGGWIADYNDPVNYLQLFESGSRFNYYGFENAEYDALVERLRQTNDDDKRQQLIIEAEAVLAQARPFISLYFYVSRHLVNHELKGFRDNLSDKHLSRYLSF